MKNKIDSFIKRLGITPYRFAKDTGLSMNNIYLLKNEALLGSV
ncbi:helix-turn-helix domain-containing protein [Microcystis aeruginosa]